MRSIRQEELTKSMRWKLAEKLAEDRLSLINEKLIEVKVKDTFYTRYGKRILDIIISFFVLIPTKNQMLFVVLH